MIDFITTHPWTVCMAWILACFLGVACIAVGTGKDNERHEIRLCAGIRRVR